MKELEEMWKEPRIYSKFEAMYDIVHERSMTTSIRKLSKRWQWSEKKVRIFLQLIKGCVEISTENGITKIQVTEIRGTAKGTVKGTPKTLKPNELQEVRAQQRAQQRAHVTEIKKNELNNRKHAFGLQLAPYVGQYPKEIIREFFDYWSEPNKSGTKMRFELEKTWSVSLRLSNWANRENRYASRTDSKQDANKYAVEQFIADRQSRAQGVVNEVERPF